MSNLTFGPFYFSDFVVSNFDADALMAVAVESGGPLYDLLDNLGQIVQDVAKEIVPVDTSRLQQSIAHVVTADDNGLVCYAGSNVPYSGVVELGSEHQSAQPYLRPALDALESAL